MRTLTFFIAAIAYFFYKFLPPTQERNILVLVETQGVYIDSLSQLTGLKTAFKVVTNVDYYIFGDDMRVNIEKRVRNYQYLNITLITYFIFIDKLKYHEFCNV